MVETIPTLTYGKVVGRFLAAVADGTADVDLYPDGIPLTGNVIFTPSAAAVIVSGASPDPVTVLPAPIVTTLDSEGYISLNGQRGVFLLATDTQETNPTNFTYKVSFSKLQYAGTNTVQYPSFDIAVPAGSLRDLSTISPVPSANGAPIIRDESAVVNAQNAALAAAQEAEEWAAVAQAAAEEADNAGGAVSSVAGRIGDVVLTASDVNLGNVANLAPADLPVSTATATALDGKAATAHTHTVAQLSDASTVGKALATATDAATARTAIGAGTASTKADVGLGNVSNLAPADMPVSTATATALSGKAATVHTHTVSQLSDASTIGKTLATAADAPAVRLAIGAGTASTKADVGLGNVDNTADADKPVSTAQSTAIGAKYTKPANGVPKTDLEAAVQTSLGKADTALQSAPVTSVSGRTGAVTLTKSDVGLANVDNTSDANKPISTATATALSGKADATHTHTASQVSGTFGSANLPSNSVMYATTSNGTATRPTTRTDIIVFFVGPGNSPATVAAGATNGMYVGDVHIVTTA